MAENIYRFQYPATTTNKKMLSPPFIKDLFKLMNNAVYGKSLKNIRKHKDVQLVNSGQKAKKPVSASTFKRFVPFENDLVAIERLKQTLILNKPKYAEFVILELSKILIYNFN